MSTSTGERDLWAVILAGGEGSRLRPLTRAVAGDDRPKQFAKLLGDETLLDRTQRRVERLVPRERTLLVLTCAHQPFYAPVIDDLAPERVLVQPCGRDTAPAIVAALLRVAASAPAGVVAVFPSDHWVSDDAAFMGHVARAWAAVSRRPDLVVLLGIAPDAPETEYGWIEPGDWLPVGGLRRIRRFIEKPEPDVARTLHEAGCLWNSFVIVAGVAALASLVRYAAPALWEAFSAIRPSVGSRNERQALAALYRDLPASNFSEQVLGRCPANLAVLPVHGVAWSDWGRPQRVLATFAGLGLEPTWAVLTA